MDGSCAPMLRFFSLASDGATTERQIYNRIFWVIFPTLRKDSVANYAWIWTLFSPSVKGLDVLYNALMFRSYVGRWHHKIRKFVAEIFQNAKNWPLSCAKYFVWLLLR